MSTHSRPIPTDYHIIKVRDREQEPTPMCYCGEKCLNVYGEEGFVYWMCRNRKDYLSFSENSYRYAQELNELATFHCPERDLGQALSPEQLKQLTKLSANYRDGLEAAGPRDRQARSQYFHGKYAEWIKTEKEKKEKKDKEEKEKKEKEEKEKKEKEEMAKRTPQHISIPIIVWYMAGSNKPSCCGIPCESVYDNKGELYYVCSTKIENKTQ